ncbi:MAG TPA: hypothetical protein VF203_07715 [Burkholderiales bacterium]
MRRTDNTRNRAASKRAEPPAELLPFLDALAELLADDLEREQAEAEQRQQQHQPKDGGTP